MKYYITRHTRPVSPLNPKFTSDECEVYTGEQWSSDYDDAAFYNTAQAAAVIVLMLLSEDGAWVMDKYNQDISITSTK